MQRGRCLPWQSPALSLPRSISCVIKNIAHLKPLLGSISRGFICLKRYILRSADGEVNQWHFGMKVHIGVDSKSGLAHSAMVTPANAHDSQELPNHATGNETRLYGDSAYIDQKEILNQLAPKAKDFTNKRASRNTPLTDEDKETNRRKSQVRAKVEHRFRPLKSIYGFAKVRYRGLMKNANRAFALLALINLDKWGLPLTGQVRPA